MKTFKVVPIILFVVPLVSFLSYASSVSKITAYACHNCSQTDFISVVKKEVPPKKCKFTTPKGEVPQEEDWVCYKQNKTMIVTNPVDRIANKFIVYSADDSGYIEIKSLPLTKGEKSDLDIFYEIDNSFRQLSTNSIVAYADEYDNSYINKNTLSFQYSQGVDSNKNAQCNMSPFPTDFFTSKDYKQQVFNELGDAMKKSLGGQTWAQYIEAFKDTDLTGLSLGLTEVGISFNHSAASKIFVHMIYDRNDDRVMPDNRLTFSVSYGGEYYIKGKRSLGFHFELEPDLSYAGGVSISDLFTPSGSDNSVRFNGDKVDPCLVQFFERNKTQATTQTPLSSDEIYGHWGDVLDEGGVQICRFRTPITGYAGYGCASGKVQCNPQPLTYEYMGLCN
ncbi:hypothetical protein ACE012_03875 [Shewanella xiamenensis]|uniref:hypothetical protein n=1 Tax=Shewanella xiamenensis TaxID=332186 RepID=UPI0035BB0B02